MLRMAKQQQWATWESTSLAPKEEEEEAKVGARFLVE